MQTRVKYRIYCGISSGVLFFAKVHIYDSLVYKELTLLLLLLLLLLITLCLLITFANSLDPDQARQNFGPDLDSKRWHSDGISERNFRKSRIWKEKSQKTTKRAGKERVAMGLSAVVIVVFPDHTPLLFLKTSGFRILEYNIFAFIFERQSHRSRISA